MKLNQKTVGIIIAAALLAFSFVCPVPMGLTVESIKCIFIIVAILVLWISDAFPMGVTGLALVICLPLFGIMTPADTFKAFISSVFFFVLATYAISVAIMKTPLAQRLSLFFLKKSGSDVNRIILGFMVGAAFLSSIMSNVPVASLFMGLALGILEPLGSKPKESRLGRTMMIAIPFGAMAGGMATPAGSSVNVLALYLMEQATGETIPFVRWMLVGVPLCAAFIPIMWFVLIKTYKPEPVQKEFIDALIAEIEIPKKITTKEKKVLTIIGIMIAFWIISSWIPAIDITVVALLGLVAFFLPGVHVFTWDEYRDSVGWDALLVIGSVTAMGAAVVSTGLGAYLVDNILSPVASVGHIAFIAILAFVINWLHLLLPVAPSLVGITVVPVTAVATVCDMDPAILVFTIAAMSGGCYLLPLDAVPLITYSKGYYTFGNMFKSGVIVSTILCVLITVWLASAGKVFL